MTDLERSVLDFYQISTPYPEEWPAEKNNTSDASDDEGGGGGGGGGGDGEEARQRKQKLQRRKSRYQALERVATNRRSTMPGAEKGNLVQRDEPDPLGMSDSVMVMLKKRGGLGAVSGGGGSVNSNLSLQEEARLRSRFLLSSTNFSPALFLSQVHTDDSTEALLAGLDSLSRSIDQKSASLKVLVESNFERFVRAKATIDNVYREMKYRGADPAALETPGPPAGSSPSSRTRAHSRHASRNSFRGSMSGIGVASPLASPFYDHPNGSAATLNGAATGSTTNNLKRNALVKESEYGVLGVKVPLLEVSAKAEEVWGPALGGREKEDMLRSVSEEFARFHAYMEASTTITDAIRRNDYETVVEEYHRARQFAEEAKALAARLSSSGAQPTDEELHRLVVAARMWHDVDEQIQAYKRDVWRKLTSMHGAGSLGSLGSRGGLGGMGGTGVGGAREGQQQQHMELIGLLLELGVEDNPIWVWLLSRYDYLKSKIQATCEHTKVEIEVMRRQLAQLDNKPTTHAIAAHLRALGRSSALGGGLGSGLGGSLGSGSSGGGAGGASASMPGSGVVPETKIGVLDAPEVVEMWDKVHGFMAALLSGQGMLGEVVDFWQTVEGFISGRAQKALPTGFRGESLVHHRLSPEGALDLQKGALELVTLVREHVFSFFAGAPPEDVSLLFSPIPPSPLSPLSPKGGVRGLDGARSPGARFPLGNLGMSLGRTNSGNSNSNNTPPPPSPRHGEFWEKYAFWPPWSNAITGVHFLSKMLALVGTSASEMATIGSSSSSLLGDGGAAGGAGEVERLRALVGAVRERCVTALCAAWNRDAENMRFVEDWHRATDRRDVTRMPATFAAFEGTVLGGMQKILYVSEAMGKPGAGDIVLPPPTKLQQMVRSQYVTTLYKALSGMVENAERPLKKADDDWTTADGSGGSSYVAMAAASSLAPMGLLSDTRASSILDSGALNAGDRNVRMLLTLSNLQSLRSEVVPQLNTQFENAFSVKLTDETKTIRDVLSQIDSRLFQSYTRPSVDALRQVVRAGILGSDKVPNDASQAKNDAKNDKDKPREARPYVYEVLLLLVLVHSQVSTTAASLTHQVLSHLLEQTSRELLEALKQQAAAGVRYDLAGLMQATLDVEFIAQALSQYTTERAGELQGLIYQELDAHTDNDARVRLQNELPEMRSVLKRLREASKNEFACFRKPKRSGGTSAGAGTGLSGSVSSTTVGGSPGL